jgi:hypothetical protein
MYSASAWYLASCLNSFCLTWFYPFIVGLTSYWFFDFSDDTFIDALQWVAVLGLMAGAGQITGLMFGTFMDTDIVAQQWLQMVIIIFNLSAGIFANASSDANLIIRGLSYISPSRYGCELAMRKILVGQPEIYREEILDFLGYTWGI